MRESDTIPAILIAEDEAAIARLAREALAEAGYRVAVAPTHDAALRALAVGDFALVLADTEGRPLADDDPAHWHAVEELRAVARGAPIVICSAHPPAAFAGWRERGYVGLVGKPFDIDALAAAVRAILG